MTLRPTCGVSGNEMDQPLHIVGGVSFRLTSLEDLRGALERHRQGPTGPLVIGYVNPHVVTSAAEHAPITQHLAAADHVCVDGFGVAMVLRLRGVSVQRLPAHRAADLLLDEGALRGRMLLIGIEPDLIDQAVDAVQKRAAGITVVGRLSGYATEGGVQDLLDRHTDVDAVLIGAGSPRSEAIAEQVRACVDHAVVFHVGAGTLKVWAGVRQHPPSFLAALGMGWTYRFVSEPHTRSRYVLGLWKYLSMVIRPSGRVAETSQQGASTCAL